MLLAVYIFALNLLNGMVIGLYASGFSQVNLLTQVCHQMHCGYLGGGVDNTLSSLL